MFTYVFNALFGLLYLGPPVAFGAYVSSCTIFLNVSYVFPVVILLIRGRGVLKEWQSEHTYFALGKAGWFLNIVAALFVIITSVVGLPLPDLCASIRLLGKLTWVLPVLHVPSCPPSF